MLCVIDSPSSVVWPCSFFCMAHVWSNDYAASSRNYSPHLACTGYNQTNRGKQTRGVKFCAGGLRVETYGTIDTNKIRTGHFAGVVTGLPGRHPAAIGALLICCAFILIVVPPLLSFLGIAIL